MTIAWSEAWSVGNDLIDADHRHLLTLINIFEKVLSTDRPLTDLRAAVDALFDYTQGHFAREERIMLGLQYAKYDHHKHAHGELIEQLKQATQPIRDLGDVMSPSTADLPREIRDSLSGLLRHWILDHILKEDMQFKPLLAKRPGNFAP
ncbi:MAG: hemerythrin family protein [Rhodocyclaceae bacterium]|jgi:hemerythrin|nr:hemerythrin family protein [Rhodocyclaceae bacterium]